MGKIKPLLVVTLYAFLGYGYIPSHFSEVYTPKSIVEQSQPSYQEVKKPLSIDDVCTFIVCTKEDSKTKESVRDTVLIPNSKGIYYSHFKSIK